MWQHTTITQNLQQGIPTIFTKYGDGELQCLADTPGQNGDGHPYSPILSSRLRAAYHYFWLAGTNTFIGRWELNEFGRDALEAECLQQYGPRSSQAVDFELLLPNALDPDLVALYATVRDVPIVKVFVGPARLAGAATLLRCEHLIVPLINCFSEYNRVLEQLGQMQAQLVLYSASMPSKCLIHEYHKQYPASTHLDVGSGFDALFVGNTRAGQPTPERCRQFFQTLL